MLVCLGGKKYIPCEDFAACSAAIKKHIAAHFYGANDFYKGKNAGVILHPKKGEIAYVSYNGRVWESQIGKPTKEITDLTKSDL